MLDEIPHFLAAVDWKGILGGVLGEVQIFPVQSMLMMNLLPNKCMLLAQRKKA